MSLIIDDSGTMGRQETDNSESPIKKVKSLCSKLGDKFITENGSKLTLISFGTFAKDSSHTDQKSFLVELDKLDGVSGGTNFEKPIFLL